MSQTKKHSFIEQSCNIGSGFIISLLVWSFIVAPLYVEESGMFYDGHLSATDNIYITCIFTVTSFIRGYFWRRFFNRYFT